MTQPERKGRLFVEGAVIVLSILLAFAIDAGWAERLERKEEAEIRLGLQEEFEEYRSNILEGLERHGQMLAAMDVILQSIEAGEWTSPDLTIDDALGLTAHPPTSELGNSVRDALIQAGRLEIVNDPTLRRRLAEWPRYYEELLDDQVVGRRIVIEEILPYLASKGLPLSRIMAAQFGGPWPVEGRGITAEPELLEELLTDGRFRALIEIRYGFWAHTGGEYRATLEAVESILSDLRSGPR